MGDDEYDHLFKIVVVGNSSVGKTNLFQRFFKSIFLGDSKPTLGCDFSAKTLDIHGSTIRAQLWDTAGQERFRAMARTFYKGAHGCLLVYDVTNQKTFEELDKWLEEVKKQGESDLVPFLLGNKCDLEDQRAVKKEEGQEYADKLGIGFNEVSAKEDINVTESIQELCKNILKVKEPGLFQDAGAKRQAVQEDADKKAMKEIVNTGNDMIGDTSSNHTSTTTSHTTSNTTKQA